METLIRRFIMSIYVIFSIFFLGVFFVEGHLGKTSIVNKIVEARPEYLETFNYVSFTWYFLITTHIFIVFTPFLMFFVLKVGFTDPTSKGK